MRTTRKPLPRCFHGIRINPTSECGCGGKMSFPQLRVALVSVVCVIVLLSGCGTPYGAIGGSSEVQLGPDSYRVSFSPYGYISWDLAYRSALLRCAELTIRNGYRYFGVVAIENYSAVSSFPRPSYAHGFYNANTAYNPPHSLSIPFWPQPVLTIRMLRDPIPGVTLDAKAVRNRGIPGSRLPPYKSSVRQGNGCCLCFGNIDLDILVVTASPARTALKISQLTDSGMPPTYDSMH